MIDFAKLNGPTLVLTVGLPMAGKSTWARRQGVPVVCPDAIRLAMHGQAYLHQAERLVWGVAETMVRSLFLAGHQCVIVDATNGRKHAREAWRWTSWGLMFKVFDTPREACEERCREFGREDLLPVIERMAASWEPLDESDQLHLVPELHATCPAMSLRHLLGPDAVNVVCQGCGQFVPVEPTAPRVGENCAVRKVLDAAAGLAAAAQEKSGD
jgi:predicted kinase